jgi:hypothetical protein
VAIAAFDAIFVPVVTLFVLPFLALFVTAWYALAYVIDLPVIAIPVLLAARRRRETGKAMMSLPCFFVLRLANCWFMLRAVFDEGRGRRLRLYEKGH